MWQWVQLSGASGGRKPSVEVPRRTIVSCHKRPPPAVFPNQDSLRAWRLYGLDYINGLEGVNSEVKLKITYGLEDILIEVQRQLIDDLEGYLVISACGGG